MAKSDSAVDTVDLAQTLKRQARRRLIGALILGSAAAISLPLLLDHEPRYQKPEVRVEPTGSPGVRDAVASGSGVEIGRRASEASAPAAENAPTTHAIGVGTASSVGASGPVPSAANGLSGTEGGGGAISAPRAAVAPRADSVSPAARSETQLPSRGDSARTEPKPAPRADGSPSAAPLREVPKTPATPTPVPASPPPPASAPMAAGGNHVLQLGAFAQPAGARAIEERAAAMGLRAWRETVETPQGERIRVRVGPYPSRAAAEEVRSRLKAAGMDATLVSP